MVDAFNARKTALTGADLAPFMHDTITHNGKRISRDEVAHGPVVAFAAIEDVEFSVDDMSSSGDRLECILSLKPIEGDARTIQEAGGFVERFEYRFAQDGRIAECTTQLDVDAKKAEVLARAEAQKA